MQRLTRYSMYKHIRAALSAAGHLPLKGRILGVSGLDGFRHMIDPGADVVDVKFPEVDLQKLPYDEASFDVVISDQVIEHLPEPPRAIAESRRVLRPGGIAIHTTCFMHHIHAWPHDYWRMSPDALRFCCRDFSEVLECGSWGNRFAIFLCMLGKPFRRMSIPDTRWSLRHRIATHDDKTYPIVTWVVAKR